MAAPMPSAPSSSSEDDDEKERMSSKEELDFCSPKFNPLKALFSPDVMVPFQNVKTFPSIASYEAAIKGKGRGVKQSSVSADTRKGQSQSVLKGGESRSSNTDMAIENVSVARCERKEIATTSKQSTEGHGTRQASDFRFGDQGGRGRTPLDKRPENLKSQECNNSQRNVFTRMTQMSGPLKLLTRCVEERLHVRVMTRAAVSVRSICRGYVVAFDKLFNMALIDVDEIYRRPACLGKVRARRTHKLQAAQNTLKAEREEQRERFISSTQCPDKTGTSSRDVGVGFTKIKDSEECGQRKDPIRDGTVTKEGLAVSLSNERGRKSIYGDAPFPFSNFEREALMLGIPDENVEHRHVNQLFIRGENVVLVSIIN